MTTLSGLPFSTATETRFYKGKKERDKEREELAKYSKLLNAGGELGQM